MGSRQRLRADGSLQPTRPPRGLILSTGEDVPKGQSLRARMLILQLGLDDVDWRRLTGCQREATSGLYAQALADFICWLAPRYAEVRRQLPNQHMKSAHACAP